MLAAMSVRPSALALALSLLLTPSIAIAAEATCRPRVAQLSKNLASITIGAHISFGTSILGVELPAATRAELVKVPGVVVEVRDGRVAFDGVVLDGKGAQLGENLDRQLEAMIASETELPEDSPHRGRPAYLAVDHRTKVSDALGPMCLVASKRSARLVVAQRSSKPTTAPAKSKAPTWLENELATAAETPSLRGQLLSRALDRAIGSCQPIVDRIHKLPEDPAGQGAAFKRALVEGLTACDCAGADVDALEALVLRGIADGPARYSLPLEIRCEKGVPATEIPLADGTTIAQLVAELAKRGLDLTPSPFRVTRAER